MTAASQPDPAAVVRVGDVIAAGCTDGTCPVGYVTAVDTHGIRLDLYSWLTGYFTAGPRVVRWPEIATIRHATQTSTYASRGDEMFDMEPLAAFQGAWKTRSENT